ncbi:MAG: hypothetical protein NTV14_10010 [Coprothermobacterota bacterium]|nr:hypothetical protein [Coprothermobacterota bacterium]MCX5971815.1 hypothetical protein [Coprothermobacterota bacterium]
MNGMMMEGTIPSAALAATLGQRAEQMKNDLAPERQLRNLKACSLRKQNYTSFDPSPYFLLIAHPQQA